jgi:hypothetical protein
MDLLEYAKELVARGHTSHNSHLQVLKTMVVQETPPQKIKTEAVNQPPIQPKSPNNYLLASGLVLLGIAILGIGY